ncbi:MAG: polysaccharide export protein [Phycisphaerales bacterium]|nr:polysaccharide export protein [Phycisphaerales bacterium]
MSIEVRTAGRLARSLAAFAALGVVLLSTGCGMKGFLDPSKTGYFHKTPTTMPILDRIDAIEPSTNPWGETSSVTPEDLAPNDLTYTLHPGDLVDIQVYELYETQRFHGVQRRVDQGGYLSIPEVGSVPAAGYTIEQVQEEIRHLLSQEVMGKPTVSVSLVEGAAFNYIIYGHVPSPGRYTLSDPHLRLLEGLTMAGGVPLTTRRVYVVRQVNTVEAHEFKPATGQSQAQHTSPTSSAPDLESLINSLDDAPRPSPGSFPDEAAAPVQIEDLHPADATVPTVEDLDEPTTSYVYLPEEQAWVEVSPDVVQRDLAEAATTTHPHGVEPTASVDPLESAAIDAGDIILERVIEVNYQRLSRGENDLNVVIRPGDQIYVDGPPQGYYYIEGEINRGGVFELPSTAEQITLSRAIGAAGGLGALAVPSRVDLVRMVGDGREAAIRLDLGAIRNRTEPDVYLKPGDHIIIGTDFWAYPLAVFRNGLRMNYGFGFLLDRNFGNDVFGPPPVNVVGG